MPALITYKLLFQSHLRLFCCIIILSNNYRTVYYKVLPTSQIPTNLLIIFIIWDVLGQSLPTTKLMIVKVALTFPYGESS